MIKTFTITPADLADELAAEQQQQFNIAAQDLADYHAWLEDKRLEELLQFDFAPTAK